MNPTHLGSLYIFKRLVSAFTISAVVLTPMSVLALADPTPDQHWTAPHASVVRAIAAASDGSYYVAGDFTDYATSYGSAVLADASTGLAKSPFPDADGPVGVVISDGAGGWYIAGDFNRVGSIQRTGLAHINADGTADDGFDADVNLSCGLCTAYSIKALALDEDDGILYVGGYLTGATFGATTVYGVVALDAIDGTVVNPGFVPSGISGGRTVYVLALDEANEDLYVGGSFASIDGTARNNIARLDQFTGDVDATYDPDVNNTVWALALDPVSSDLYAGGQFTDVNSGTPRNRIARFNTAGTADGSFDPDVDNTVYAIDYDASGGILYAGGAFDSVNQGTTNDARNRLAAFDSVGVVVPGFDPDLNSDVSWIDLTDDGSALYVVGDFTQVGGGAIDRRDVAAFDTSDGSDMGVSQEMEGAGYYIALSDDESSFVATVNSTQYRADESVFEPEASNPRMILHILADGTVDPSFNVADAGFVEGGGVLAMALSPDESVLYIGGDFSCVGVSPSCNVGYPFLAALDASDGTLLLPFEPIPDGTVRALAVSSDGATLYVGGDFGEFEGGITRSRLAALDTSGGDPTAFDPDISGGGNTVRALELTADDSVLYIGGDFTAFFGPTFRNNIAAATTAGTGAAVAAFDPDVNDVVYALALSADEDTVYAGGNFTTVNQAVAPMTRMYAAAFTATTGVTTAFDPDVNSNVNALAFGPDGILYMGGDFDDTDHEYITAVDPDTGAPEAGFKTNLSDDVFALAHGGTGNGLLAGGDFTNSFQDDGGLEIPYVVTLNIAHYADSATPTPTPVPPTPTPTPGGGSHSSGGGGAFLPGFSPTPTPTPAPGAPQRGDPANLARYGLHEGDVVGAPTAGDPDVYIVNEWGYKRLFLNPVIFSFYGHLKFSAVHDILPPGRDAFPVSGLFRNCEANDPQVYAVEVTGEDTGMLHHVQMSGAAAVSQDPEFFKKVFCINNNEFNWYPKSPTPYTALSQVPVYWRR